MPINGSKQWPGPYPRQLKPTLEDFDGAPLIRLRQWHKHGPALALLVSFGASNQQFEAMRMRRYVFHPERDQL